MPGDQSCPRCGQTTAALHLGGDANIASPGVCDLCQVELVTTAHAARDKSRAAKIAAVAAPAGAPA